MTTSKTKVALITGAATGMGRAFAIRLAKEGIAIAVNYVGDSKQADEVVNEIRQAGGTAVGFPADVKTIFTPSSMIIWIISSIFGYNIGTFTPNGLSVAFLHF